MITYKCDRCSKEIHRSENENQQVKFLSPFKDEKDKLIGFRLTVERAKDYFDEQNQRWVQTSHNPEVNTDDYCSDCFRDLINKFWDWLEGEIKRDKINKYEEALKFYAEGKNFHIKETGSNECWHVCIDEGEVARAALEENK